MWQKTFCSIDYLLYNRNRKGILPTICLFERKLDLWTTEKSIFENTFDVVKIIFCSSLMLYYYYRRRRRGQQISESWFEMYTFGQSKTTKTKIKTIFGDSSI